MSFERFVVLFQILITMTNPIDQDEVLNALNILKNLKELADRSGKADQRTLEAMENGYRNFRNFLKRREDFAGRPGDHSENQIKQQRLAMILRPHC